jgi:hypothetical protein
MQVDEKKSVGQLEESLHKKGNPVPAYQDKDDSNNEKQIDQQLSGRYFSPGWFKLYHFSMLFISEGIYRVCQS